VNSLYSELKKSV